MRDGAAPASPGARAIIKTPITRISDPPTAKIRYVLLHPYRSINRAANGFIISVPTPIPATEIPTAVARDFSNHPPT